jgi:hypothetical protein
MPIITSISTVAKEIFYLCNAIKGSRGDRRARAIHYCNSVSNHISELAAELRLNRIPNKECIELRDTISRCSEVMLNIADVPGLTILLDELCTPNADKKIYDEFNSSNSKEGELKLLDEASGLLRALAKSAHAAP